MNKRVLISLICVLLCTILSGCWDNIELDNIAIVNGLFIDKTPDNNYSLTAEIANPVSGENQQNSSIIKSATGETISKAASLLIENVLKQGYWSHTKVAILSENYASKGIKELIDFFTREFDKRAYVNLVLFKDSNIFENKGDETSYYISDEISNILKNDIYNGRAVNRTVADFIKESEDLTGVSMIDQIERDIYPQVTTVNSKSSLRLGNTGIFYKYKLIGFINKEETKTLNIIRDNIKTSTISYILDNKNSFTFKITKCRTKIKPLIKDDKYSLTVDTSINADLIGYDGTRDLSKIDSKELQGKIENKLEEDMKLLTTKAKNDFKVDILGSGNKFMNKYRFLTKFTQQQWNDIFVEKVNIVPDVHFHIDFTGASLNKIGGDK